MAANRARLRRAASRSASASALVAALGSSCTGTPSAPSGAPADISPVTVASLAGVDTASLPALPASMTGMPRAIPRNDPALPSLLDDLPGRAAVVVNPEITTVNTPVASWADLDLLFYGVDGRWRRLSLEDLGLSASLTFTDTYGSGELSSDGRWWAGPTREGTIALNLATGESHLMPGSLQTWVPGTHTMLTTGSEMTVPGGIVTRVPYYAVSVGHEPDGTPLSLVRGADGRAVLVEWRGTTRHVRTVVPGITQPRRQLTAEPTSRIIPSSQLSLVSATRGRFATSELRGRSGMSIVVADSATGGLIGELGWKRRDFELYYDDTWLDDQTLLIATAPYFVGWRPATGELYRVTDARSVGEDTLWDLSVAQETLRRAK